MYIEDKSAGLTGPCRIGLVRFSKSGTTLYYGDRAFKSLGGSGFKANYADLMTGDEFWISGPRRDGHDGLYGRRTQPQDVDADVAHAYWRDIRGFATVPAAPASARQGDGLRAAAADRLPFDRRDSVEHPRLEGSQAPPPALGRKGSRIENQFGRFRGTPDA